MWAGAEPSSGISSGGESFRSGLQSLLAPMGTGNEGSSIKRAAALPALERPFAEAGLRDAGATCGSRVNPLSVQGRMQKVEIAAGRTVSSLPDSQASLPYLNSSPLTPEATVPAAAKQGANNRHAGYTALQGNGDATWKARRERTGTDTEEVPPFASGTLAGNTADAFNLSRLSADHSGLGGFATSRPETSEPIETPALRAAAGAGVRTTKNASGKVEPLPLKPTAGVRVAPGHRASEVIETTTFNPAAGVRVAPGHHASDRIQPSPSLPTAGVRVASGHHALDRVETPISQPIVGVRVTSGHHASDMIETPLSEPIAGVRVATGHHATEKLETSPAEPAAGGRVASGHHAADMIETPLSEPIAGVRVATGHRASDKLASPTEPAAGVRVASGHHALDRIETPISQPIVGVRVASGHRASDKLETSPTESTAGVRVASGHRASDKLETSPTEPAAGVRVASGHHALDRIETPISQLIAGVRVASGHRASDKLETSPTEPAAGVRVASGHLSFDTIESPLSQPIAGVWVASGHRASDKLETSPTEPTAGVRVASGHHAADRIETPISQPIVGVRVASGHRASDKLETSPTEPAAGVRVASGHHASDKIETPISEPNAGVRIASGRHASDKLETSPTEPAAGVRVAPGHYAPDKIGASPSDPADFRALKTTSDEEVSTVPEPSRVSAESMYTTPNQIQIPKLDPKTETPVPTAGSSELAPSAAVVTAADSSFVQSTAIPATQGKAAPSGGMRKATEPVKQTADAAGPAGWAQHGNPVAESVPVAAALNAVNAVESANPAVLRGSLNPATGTDIPGSAASDRDSREAFATLDGGPVPLGTTWAHAGARHAEAGYQDPALGWVGVRADAGGAGIHATVVPGSADAAQALGGHIAGLNAYMAEHHTAVGSVTLAAPEGRGADAGLGQNSNQSFNQGAHQGAQQDPGQRGQSARQSKMELNSPTASLSADGTGIRAQSITQDSSGQMDWPKGTHISLMA